jgi:hypothetical protein
MHLLCRAFIIVLLILKGFSAMSQDDSIPRPPKNPFKNKLYTGGGFGLQIGDNTYIAVSPILGYNITQKLSVGVGGSYQYARFRQFDVSSSTFGGSVFTRYIIWRSIFAYVEYEQLNLDYFELRNNSLYRKRVNIRSLFAGGGIRQMLGENAAVVLMILYNFNDTPYSPYTNPVFRFGFEIGL